MRRAIHCKDDGKRSGNFNVSETLTLWSTLNECEHLARGFRNLVQRCPEVYRMPTVNLKPPAPSRWASARTSPTRTR